MGAAPILRREAAAYARVVGDHLMTKGIVHGAGWHVLRWAAEECGRQAGAASNMCREAAACTRVVADRLRAIAGVALGSKGQDLAVEKVRRWILEQELPPQPSRPV